SDYSVKLIGEYDFVTYSASDSVLSFSRDAKETTSKIGSQSRLALTNVGTSTMVIEGPYDAFKISKRSNPVLLKQPLTPKENIEFKYKKDRGSTTVRLTGKHDYALYNAQEHITNYLTRTSAGSANLGVGNRLAVMNTADEAIEAYGVYDLLEVSQRSTPVTFTEKLLPGKSIELKNKATSTFSVNLTGEYDFVTYSASDSVLSIGRDVKATISTIESQSRLALTNVGTSTMVIEGSYDAFEINKRSNPVLIKQPLAPNENIELKYKKDRGSTTVYLTGKHDLAMYNAQGQQTSYSRRTSTGSASLGVGNRLAVMNAATEAIEAYGVYD
ncbi:hypothetical protein KDN24_20105, partial [Bacillus sp. Bva_UNVM-123]|uniref:hypothetical protein n=1 Tax=Bacillus sp. Bva_UNVM-123 TaxID=2829798 RepID=UPI00391EE51B